MKIAFITDNGKEISPFYGDGLYVLVLTVENDEIIHQDLRAKFTFGRHPLLIEPISDCDVLICGGMEQSTYEMLMGKGIKPIVTDQELIGPTLHLLFEGTLEHRAEKVI